ncbi:MAG TPA: glycosyltransferase family protein [Kofleriaceae bacterium]|nr:glycosyltransferase family protein [Kofleriaceae bacterium]
MTTAAIIQARMGSSRLPGKVLADIAGASMLARVVERVRAANVLDDVIVATSTASSDDALADECARLDVRLVRGPEDDVLTRYVMAARGCDAIIRVTADCPLLDPRVLADVVHALDRDVDYASNTHVRSFPRGLDVEAVHADTLARLDRLAQTPASREHVTSFVLEEPSLFRVRHVRAERDDSDLRWTVDTPEDLALVRTLYARFGLANDPGPYTALVAAVRREPALGLANAHVEQKHWSNHAR